MCPHRLLKRLDAFWMSIAETRANSDWLKISRLKITDYRFQIVDCERKRDRQVLIADRFLPGVLLMNMQEQVREKKIVAATSAVAAVFLTGGKLVIGLLTGSLGILAEAAHSALDLVAAAITFFAVRISDRPADESHPYGHGKVENLSALAETLLLLITCVWIIYEGIQRLFYVSVKVDASLWAFLIMAISIVVDYSRSRALSRVAKKYKSQALEADAWLLYFFERLIKPSQPNRDR